MSDDTLTYEPNPEASDAPTGAFGTFAEDGTYTPRQITDDDLGGKLRGCHRRHARVRQGSRQFVEGTVVKVDRDEVLLDIGYKSEGVIPSRELSIRNDVDPNEIVSMGDKIEALVLTKEDKEGRLVLSKKRAQYEHTWGDIKHVEEEDGVVTDRSSRSSRAASSSTSACGFLPASLVELRQVRRPPALRRQDDRGEDHRPRQEPQQRRAVPSGLARGDPEGAA